MIPCSRCAELSANSCRCDHCGAELGRCGSSRPSSALLLGLVLTGCELIIPSQKDLYGAPDSGYLDDDDDGYPEFQDCNDADPAIHPDAEETVGDGTDSNCDGEDDT